MGNAVPSSLVEISVECRNLVDMDVFSKSDPMVVLFTWEVSVSSWKEFGRTEIIWDNLNPVFIKKFVMDYFFEESQKLKFEVYDVDSKSRDLRNHDFLGSTECTLGEIVSSARLQKALNTRREQQGGPKVNSGSIIFTAEELSTCKEEVTMQLCGHKLDKKDFFGKSDPFLVFLKSNEDGSFTAVHKTEVIKNTLNPTWRTFTEKVRTLCNGDHDRSIKIECYDWNQSGSHDLIGGFITSLRELERGPGPQNSYELIHPEKKAKKKKYKHSGTIELLSAKVVAVPTFLDYIKGGTQIHCTISIDFTASNGNPQSPTSLHYMSPYQPNQYARALRAVGEIIQDYDSTKMFPALGFGARLPPDGKVSHEFFLNGNPNNPYCQGIEGVLQAYNQALRTVQLYGPTNFAPTINHVARFAAANKSGSDYYILLIITDGVITDMPQTKEAIVNASMLPLSIIIVGVGDAEFDAMDELDGDEVRLSSRGRVAARDIVQFVPFREFLGNNTLAVSQARLAKEVLAEVPDQVISYMRANNIKPRPPLERQATFATAPVS
ncbi:copine-8-like isoform X2 [Lineus longissimus]|uniref:copine-8-like isoform X2 n=1 Tax=Lineus longissimus TaxID=88925 RepID=UPI00315CE7C6